MCSLDIDFCIAFTCITRCRYEWRRLLSLHQSAAKPMNQSTRMSPLRKLPNPSWCQRPLQRKQSSADEARSRRRPSALGREALHGTGERATLARRKSRRPLLAALVAERMILSRDRYRLKTPPERGMVLSREGLGARSVGARLGVLRLRVSSMNMATCIASRGSTFGPYRNRNTTTPAGRKRRKRLRI